MTERRTSLGLRGAVAALSLAAFSTVANERSISAVEPERGARSTESLTTTDAAVLHAERSERSELEDSVESGHATPTPTPTPPPTPTPVLEARSGYEYQSAEIQALQDDDFANPGMLWVDQGAALWREEGPAGEPSCQSCHGDPSTLRGAAVRYPKHDAASQGLINLEGRVNQCRTQQQRLPALAYESEPLLSLTALVAHQSRGMPIDVSIDGPARPFFEEGRDYFYTRRGQMNLACHHCHELNAGNYLRGDRLSQGQPTGYPIYRLDWQTLGSLHRRIRFCNTGVRAEPFDFGDSVYLGLELFLAWRAQGLPSEAPAVRR